MFNHVYNYETSVFEKIVPNYYFRKTSEGIISNGSGVGNDFATERPMNSLHCPLSKFNLLRLPLYKGLIDSETIKNIELEVGKIKPNFLLYGEGWEMATTLDKNSDPQPNLPMSALMIREIVKGRKYS